MSGELSPGTAVETQQKRLRSLRAGSVPPASDAPRAAHIAPKRLRINAPEAFYGKPPSAKPDAAAAMWQNSSDGTDGPGGGLPDFEGYTTPRAPDQAAAPPGLGTLQRHVSVSGDDGNPRPFEDFYDLQDELGRGAFSTVFRCRNKASGLEFAAKVIDLRPLRLRQAFKIDRLRREYEIMRRLKNPHIIQLEEVFETHDTLVLVMEFCPGIELFDAIIAQRSCPENAAAIIFYQCLVALSYLHKKHIIHRDIKPENILLCKADAAGRSTVDNPGATEARSYPVVKLLDFGLSKVLTPSEGGSAARTFVGTPCYVAPEVEANAQGQNVAYGTAVDLWSAGALLYVMLIARFPEVDRQTHVVSMGVLEAAGVSTDARNLIQRLMEPDPSKRLTAEQAMGHDWLAAAAKIVPVPLTSEDRYASADASLTKINGNHVVAPTPRTAETALTPYGENPDIMEEELPEARAEAKAAAGADHIAGQLVQYSPLAPLTNMQKKVAQCMALAHAAYADSPAVAAEVRRSAIICRTAQVESSALLRRVQQTADSVLDLIPDLELAVAEQEPELAMEFFSTVRNWVQRLTDEITRVQAENKNSLVALSDAFEAVATEGEPPASGRLRMLEGPDEADGGLQQPKRKMGRRDAPGREATGRDANGWRRRRPSEDKAAQMELGRELSTELTASQLTKLVHGLKATRVASDVPASSMDEDGDESPSASMEEKFKAVMEDATPRQRQLLEDIATMPEEELLDLFLSPNVIPNNPYTTPALPNAPDPARDDSPNGVAETVRALVLRDPSPQAATAALGDALKHLEGVDAILHHLQNFWSSTEVIFDTLLQRSDHVERFIKFAHKPRLALRFQERLSEYTHFWQGVRSVAVDCITGHCAKAAYSFLQDNHSAPGPQSAGDRGEPPAPTSLSTPLRDSDSPEG